MNFRSIFIQSMGLRSLQKSIMYLYTHTILYFYFKTFNYYIIVIYHLITIYIYFDLLYY